MNHWKDLTDSPYLGSYSLDGKSEEVVLTITGVKSGVIVGDGGKKSVKPIASFKERKVGDVTIKPMVLNATNCKTITKLAGSAIISNWTGLQITVFIKRKLKLMNGEIIDALRIRDKAPQTKEKDIMSPTHAKWAAMIEAIKAEKYSIELLCKQYTVSKESLNLIKEAIR